MIPEWFDLVVRPRPPAIPALYDLARAPHQRIALAVVAPGQGWAAWRRTTLVASDAHEGDWRLARLTTATTMTDSPRKGR